jgi:5-hydroxyisourate hydrolase-like protein (transthyretin family)
MLLRLVTCVLICLVLATVTAVSSAESSTTDAKHLEQWLAFLNEKIVHQIELVQLNADQDIDFEVLDREVKRLSARLDEAERLTQALEPVEGLRLLRKVASLRDMVYNLELTVRTRRAAPLGSVIDAQGIEIKLRGLGDAVPVNDACESAIPIGLGTYTGSTAGATNDGSACGASMLTPDVWFLYEPVSGTRVKTIFDTVGSSFDTVLSIHGSCPGTIDNQYACNDDYFGLQSSLSYSVSSGYGYLIRLSGVNGATGAYTLNIGLGGEISGTVTAEATGDYLDNVVVKSWDTDGRYIGSDYSDSEGNYSLMGHVTGSFYAGTDLTSDSPFIDELYDDIMCPGGPGAGCDLSEGSQILVTNGATSTADLALTTGGRITGTVSDVGTGIGISGVNLEIFNDAGTYIRSTYTDSDGQYEIEGLLDGSYFLVAESSSYVDTLYDGHSCHGGVPWGCDPTTGTPIAVTLEAVVSGIDLNLQQLGSISGSVTDASTGAPLDHVDVKIYRSSGYYLKRVYTSEDGSYLIGGLADGTYYLVAEEYDYLWQVFDGIDCGPYECDPPSGTAVVISGYSSVESIDFALNPMGKISGIVTNTVTGLPASGVLVTICRESGSVVDYRSTDNDGVYTSKPLVSGTYYVRTNDREYNNKLFDDIPCDGCTVSSGTPISVSAAVVTSGIDFALIPRGAISGTITSATTGTPLTNIKVRVFNNGSSDRNWYDYTDSTGLYTIRYLPADSYFVVTDESGVWLDRLYDGIECPGGPSLGCNYLDGTPVTVTDASTTTDIDFLLDSAGVVSGSVTDSIDGSPLTGVSVLLINTDSRIVGSASISNGMYTLNQILPGEYYLVADNWGGTHVDGIYNGLSCAGEYPDLCDATAGDLISVEANSVINGVDFALDRCGLITGTVLDGKSGEPLSSFRVERHNDIGKSYYDYTDSSGAFEFKGLWPGSTIYIVTNQKNSYYIDQLYSSIPCPGGSSNCDVTSGTPITVVSGETFDITIDLQRSGGISGQIIDEETRLPIRGYEIEVYDSQGTYKGYARTDSNGMYTYRGLFNGSYFVKTDDPSYGEDDYLNELYDDIPCWTVSPSGCDPTKGTPVEVSIGQIRRFVDFSLQPVTASTPPPETGISGVVTDIATGAPISGVIIDIWDSTTLDHLESVITDEQGSYLVEIDDGTYYVSTDNAMSWTNLIWDGHKCQQGSAFDGGCEPEIGNQVTVVADEVTDGIDFVMSGLIFEDGFESGDVSAWSTSAGS